MWLSLLLQSDGKEWFYRGQEHTVIQRSVSRMSLCQLIYSQSMLHLFTDRHKVLEWSACGLVPPGSELRTEYRLQEEKYLNLDSPYIPEYNGCSARRLIGH
jgi:hypothetical protein